MATIPKPKIGRTGLASPVSEGVEDEVKADDRTGGGGDAFYCKNKRQDQTNMVGTQ